MLFLSMGLFGKAEDAPKIDERFWNKQKGPKNESNKWIKAIFCIFAFDFCSRNKHNNDFDN